MSGATARTAWTIVIVLLVLLLVVGAVLALTANQRGGGAGVPEGAPTATAPRSVGGGYALDRADPAGGGLDAIVTFSVQGESSSRVYEAERIIDFALAGETLVVVADAGGAHSVTLVDTATGTPTPVALPGEGTVDAIAASADRVGFLFTSAGDPLTREFASTLLWFRIDHPTAGAILVEGEPLATSAWAWVPERGHVLAVGAHEDLLLLDPADPGSVEELGHWEGIESVSADGTRAIVRDHHDTVELSLVNGESQAFGPTPVDGVAAFGGDVVFLPGSSDRVQKVALTDSASGRLESAIIRDTGAESRVLYRAAAPSGIDHFEVSPDGRLVAVEMVPDVASMVSDGYYPHARAVSVVTLVISVADGRVLGEIPGFGVQWSDSVG